ncbi:SAM hydrolase/SAM-dependent halogenase family protein [Yinghuangia sp. YIM S09857]|uniref:SAM hydrolase/SAM-dependent halogenase family protein n=1 Tax=Yinghuangia sp. YIM S09857 TaxID=3436929 RepID=UPI003F536D63
MDAHISFLTDYGTADGFVAACHGVIMRIAPGARVLDVSHEVPPGDIRRGAVLLAQTLPYLPPGVAVAVVDPGVGTARRGVLVRTAEHLLVGPDNGLLMWAADAVGGALSAHELTTRELMLPRVSATFHGRDVFAPMAAHLATGTSAHRVGPTLDPGSLVRLPDPVAYVVDGTAHGEVLTVDRFGNVQTSLAPAELTAIGAAPGGSLTLRTVDGTWTAVFGRTFADVPLGEPVAVVDSTDHLAIAVNGGNAAATMRLAAEAQLSVTRAAAY